ncbi:hypothetical protein L830_2721 [Mycobacteroides abscessus MAB_082312_2258]|nr:hypothetical protein L830_2721 [Mycobacteroides abscessus MAB_082312_2258]
MTDIVERALTLDDADPEELAEMAEEPNPGSAETQTTGKAAKKKTAKTIKAVEPASDRAVSEGEGDSGPASGNGSRSVYSHWESSARPWAFGSTRSCPTPWPPSARLTPNAPRPSTRHRPTP